MLKSTEISSPNSCWNKAKDGDFVFVLIEGDTAAPVAIEAWCRERIRLGLNADNDQKIVAARVLANAMTPLGTVK